MTNTPTNLSTFVLVDKDKIISPVLTTTREYGRWFEDNFDKYTSMYELYCKSLRDGKSVMEYHPGTRIGKFFDSNKFTRNTLQSWFILQDCNVVTKLKRQKLTEIRDCIPISVNDSDHRRMLRCYTVDQIQTYIKNNVDRDFCIDTKILPPKMIKVSGKDLKGIIAPKVVTRKTLFTPKER